MEFSFSQLETRNFLATARRFVPCFFWFLFPDPVASRLRWLWFGAPKASMYSLHQAWPTNYSSCFPASPSTGARRVHVLYMLTMSVECWRICGIRKARESDSLIEGIGGSRGLKGKTERGSREKRGHVLLLSCSVGTHEQWCQFRDAAPTTTCRRGSAHKERAVSVPQTSILYTRPLTCVK